MVLCNGLTKGLDNGQRGQEKLVGGSDVEADIQQRSRCFGDKGLWERHWCQGELFRV